MRLRTTRLHHQKLSFLRLLGSKAWRDTRPYGFVGVRQQRKVLHAILLPLTWRPNGAAGFARDTCGVKFVIDKFLLHKIERLHRNWNPANLPRGRGICFESVDSVNFVYRFLTSSTVKACLEVNEIHVKPRQIDFSACLYVCIYGLCNKWTLIKSQHTGKYVIMSLKLTPQVCVTCDRCKRTNLQQFAHLGVHDLCLRCVETPML